MGLGGEEPWPPLSAPNRSRNADMFLFVGIITKSDLV